VPADVAGGESMRSACKALPGAVVHSEVQDMAALMLAADLALGASGISTWERCCVALPALTVAVAEHQSPVAEAVHNIGAAVFLGRAEDVDTSLWSQHIGALADPARLRSVSAQAYSLVDGEGVSRILDAMGEL
jgi:UDP-2,4-diacetamido-2,4,6-trideoxy-beta-L-altropyranose hydrolase